MKSAVESLNPTRVRLTVEVPFEELKPSVDVAYRTIAQQVQMPGFRRGKVPPRLIDQRFGREIILDEAVKDALPKFYDRAVVENSVQVLGPPEVDITELTDGARLRFTADVDVRPEIDLTAYYGMDVAVPDREEPTAGVHQRIELLQERFATLVAVDRPAQEGDFASIDLVAVKKDGQEVPDGSMSGVSYQVGSGSLVEGLDGAMTGLAAGESRTFSSRRAGDEPAEPAEDAEEDVDVTVMVKSVKVREFPTLDDEFAQMASEFDTLDELTNDIRERLVRRSALEQVAQARDRILEALLAKVDVPLPEGVVKAQLDLHRTTLQGQLDAAGLTLAEYLASKEMTTEEHEAITHKLVREEITIQMVLDAIALKEQVGVGEAELTEHIVRRAHEIGVPPERFAQQAVQARQVPALVGEVRRGKALVIVLESAKVTDDSGRPVDLNAFREDDSTPDAGDTEDVSLTAGG